MSETVQQELNIGGKYLTFHLAEEEYGLEILKVQEIIGVLKVTRVPHTPEYIRGVINLRGKVIPVLDLRTKFGLEPHEATDRECIIVIQVQRDNQTVIMGIMVDEVSEVKDIPQANIDPAPQFGAMIDTSFILGMGKVEEKVVTLLDIDKVLTASEAVQMEKIGKSE